MCGNSSYCSAEEDKPHCVVPIQLCVYNTIHCVVHTFFFFFNRSFMLSPYSCPYSSVTPLKKRVSHQSAVGEKKHKDTKAFDGDKIPGPQPSPPGFGGQCPYFLHL